MAGRDPAAQDRMCLSLMGAAMTVGRRLVIQDKPEFGNNCRLSALKLKAFYR
jgi:hypothetical protein